MYFFIAHAYLTPHKAARKRLLAFCVGMAPNARFLPGQRPTPTGPMARDLDGKYLVTGQMPCYSAVHTTTDIPLCAFGPGAYAFTGVIDDTDVFFKLAQVAVRGVAWRRCLECQSLPLKTT